jgi:hypothetical protein
MASTKESIPKLRGKANYRVWSNSLYAKSLKIDADDILTGELKKPDEAKSPEKI